MHNLKSKKIIITGGHVTPALSVMLELANRGWECIYVGRKHALEGDASPSEEMKLVLSANYKFIPISTGRLQRQFTRYTLTSLLKIPLGLFQALKIIIQNKPQIILSFGGYIALPIVLIGWYLKVPIVTHEQTLSSGLANRIITFLSRKVCVSWPMSMHQFPINKTVYTGLPLRREIFQIQKQLTIDNHKPVIYITGGNLGSTSINRIIEEILPKLLIKYSVIHQCGKSKNNQDFQKLSAIKNNLPKDLRLNYQLFTYIEPEYIGSVFSKSDILISRSGANIITEIIALKKLAILIPLPWSGMKEQEINAKFLSDNGAAVTILQKDLNGEHLMQQIKYILDNRQRFEEKLQFLNSYIIKDSPSRIVKVIESIA